MFTSAEHEAVCNILGCSQLRVGTCVKSMLGKLDTTRKPIIGNPAPCVWTALDCLDELH